MDFSLSTSLRDLGRWTLRVVGGLLLFLLLVAGATVGLLQTEWGADKVREIAVAQVNQVVNGEIAVGRLGGNFLSYLELHDVRAVQENQQFARLDRIRVQFRLRELLRRKVHLRQITASNLDVDLHEHADGTWNIEQFLPEPAAADPSAAAWTVQIDNAELSNSRIQARFYSPQGDSTLEARDLNLAAETLTFGPDASGGRLTRLNTAITAFNQPAPYRIGAAAEINERELRLDSLRIQSDRTNIYAEASYPWAEGSDSREVSAILDANPVALADLQPFVPTLSRSDTLYATAELSGTTNLLHLQTDARITRNGDLSMNASFTPPSEQPVRYQASAQLRNLNLVRLTGAASGVTNLAADLQVDLQGSSLQELSGTANTRIRNLNWNDNPLRPTELNTTWNDGHVSFDGRTELARGRLSLQGEANPFADIPSYSLLTQFRNLNLRRLPGMLEETDLTGDLTLAGSRFEPEEMVLDGELNLRNSSYATYHVERGRLNAQMRQSSIEVTSDIRMRGGRFGGRIHLEPFEDPIQYRLRDGQFQNVDLAVLLNDTTMTSNLNGSVNATGKGTDLDRLIMDGAVTLDGSTYLDRDIERAELRAGLRSQRLSFRGSMRTPGGRVELDGSGRPFGRVPSLDRFTAAFQDVDPEYLTQDTTYSGRLNGRLSGRASGAEPSAAIVNAELQLDTSRVNTQTINSAAASLQLRNQRAAVALLTDLPEGSVEAEGSIRPFDEMPTYSFENVRFSGLHLGRWLDQPELSTRLTGTADLTGRGFDPETAAFDGRIRLDTSRVNRFTIDRGTFELGFREQHMTADLHLEYPTGHTSASGSADLFEEQVGFTADGRIRGLQPFDLAGLDTLDGSVNLGFDLQGRGETFSTMAVDGTVSAGESHLEGLRIDSLFTRFAYRDRGVQTDTLLFRSNAVDLSGGGLIALPDTVRNSQFAFSGRVHSLEPLGSLAGLDQLQGSGQINGRVFSTSRTLRFDVNTRLAGLDYGGLHAAQFDVRLLGEYRDQLALDVNTNVRALSVATLVVDGIDAEAYYTDQTVDFTTNWIIDGDREGRLRGQVETLPGRERVVIDSLSMRMNQRQWQLLQPAEISYTGEYRISQFLLFSENQQFAIDGIIDPGGEHDLITTIDRVELDPFADLFGFEGLGGELEGSLVLTGPARSPQLDGNLTLENFRANQRPVGNFLMDLSYDDFLMDIDARLVHDTNRELLISGTLPFDLSMNGTGPPANQDIDLQARADSISIAWIEPFLDPETAQELNGHLTADLHVGGTYNTPNTDGFFRITGGSVRLPALGTRYTDINLEVTHQDTTATIQQASLRSGDGRMQIDGVVHLSALDVGNFDLAINAKNFRAANTPDYRLSVNSRMTMRGTTTRPVVGGQLTLTQATFNLGDQISSQDVEQITLSEQDIRQLEARFGIYVTEGEVDPYDFYEAMEIDTLDVSILRNVWLRSTSAPEMAIEFTGDLTVVKPAYGDLQAFGSIEVIPTRSYVSQFGRRFDIATGTLTFNGPIENPNLDVQAEYNLRGRPSSVGQAQITLGLQGPLDDLRFDLGSEQGLTNVEIVSYLILGRPPGQSMQGGGSVGSVATTAAISQITELVEGLAATELGLDVIEIRHDQDLGATLTAGAYLTRNLFTSVSWPISLAGSRSRSTSGRRITVEYILTNWVVLQLQREEEALGLELLWEYSY